MADVEAIAEYSITNVQKLKYKWKIKKFSSYGGKTSVASATAYRSETFYFADSTWYLQMIPNYTENDKKYLSVSLLKAASGSPATADISIGIMSVDHTIVNEEKGTHVFSDENPEWKHLKFLAEVWLKVRKYQLLHFDTLILVCSLQVKQTPNFQIRYGQVSEDLKKLFNSKEDTDVQLNVEEKTFLAHKIILGARSPVLKAMFKNNMVENETGIVNISDCNAEAFNIFLIFLYTGSVNFTKCNVCELYKIADKYEVLELKSMCGDFLAENLCIENFCDASVLCKQFSDAKLLSAVRCYFFENFDEVNSSEDFWKFLLHDYGLELIPANMTIR